MYSRHQVFTWMLLLTLLSASTAFAGLENKVVFPMTADRSSSAEIAEIKLLETSDRGMTLSLDVPHLEMASVSKDGQTFQTMTLPGGDLSGRQGQPELPILSRLVVVPAGKTLRVRSIDKKTQTLDAIVQPVPAQGLQDKNATFFAVDTAYYAGDLGKNTTPVVDVGVPGLMRGVRVVPVTFNPVSWDPRSGQAEVCYQVDVDLELIAADDANNPSKTLDFIPESFLPLFEDVLGFDKGDATETGLGTWLIIMPTTTGVADAVQPLIDWRQRQGYNVVAVNTSVTGTSNYNIMAYLEDQYDDLEIPLEFVTLVGDANGSIAIPTWPEELDSHSGSVGDHDYTRLDGGDIIADVHLGRLSVTSVSELETVVDKIVSYETKPHTNNDTEWFTRAGLTGDPTSSSGYSTIWVSQWAKEQLLRHNYTSIDTIWSGNFLAEMMTTINAGETLFTYRGFMGMSSMSSGYISTLSNGYKLPFAVILTCDTGTFEQDDNCRSEAFLRAPNGGGIAAIGTATTGTHTRYNNCVYQGIIEGVLNSGDPRFGPALTRGKLHLYRNYGKIEPDPVQVWSSWNNLMGDPATPMWSAYPAELDVQYPETLNVGANAVPVTVTQGGQPVSGARVALYQDGFLQISGLTDAAGHLVLSLTGATGGEVLLTVTGQNLYPHQGGFNIGTVTASADLVDYLIDDDANGQSSGNGDALASAGETLELNLRVQNNGTGGVSNVSATLSCDSPLVTIVDPVVQYGHLSSGSGVWGAEAHVVTLAQDAPGGTVVDLVLTATDGAQTWTSLLPLTITGPGMRVASASYGGVGSMIDPGETGTIQLLLRNIGNLATSGFTAHLSTDSQWLSIADSDAVFGAIAVGSSGNNSSDLFSFSADADCYPGHLATLTVDIVFDEGGTQALQFMTTIGITDSTDPVGPDNYGYYAFDNTDTAYDLAPQYQWVEIDPNYGGSGTSVGLSDYGRYQDDTKQIDLPFTFTYYGDSFDRASVCSNGWVAMGETYLRHFRNWTIPSPGTPDNLIAVFWDDLYLPSSNGGVFHWYDAANHRVIIEWSHMRIYTGSSSQVATFQVHLYDPAYNAGDTGDGLIVCQYQTVNLLDWETGYVTAGIQNQTRDDGLLYTYWDQYPSAAAEIEAGRAIAYRTMLPQISGTLKGSISNSYNDVAVDGATISLIGSGRTLSTQPNGRFEGLVPVGTFDVAVQHPGFEPDTTRGVVINEDLETVVDMQLVDNRGPLYDVLDQPVSTSDTSGPYTVTARITDYSGLSQNRFYYTSSATGGPFELTLQSQPDQAFTADIPGQPAGTLIQYWFVGEDAVNHQSVEPYGAPFDVHSFVINDITVLATSDMETDDGWTSGVDTDTASAGLWVRLDPTAILENQVVVQPEDDHTLSGTQCWVTGNAPEGSNQGVEDVDGGSTTLQSPVYDIATSSGLQVDYYRWYTNDTGYSPGEDIWQVQVLDQNSQWVDLESTNVSARAWQLQSFYLDDYADLGSTTQFRFVATDVGGGSVIEAAVDDFTLMSNQLPQDLTAPSVDLLTFNDGGSIQGGTETTVAWTHSDDIGVVQVEILLSVDGGSTYPITVANGAVNTSVPWTVPAVESNTCRLKVVCHDTSGKSTESVSASDFSITGVTSISDLPTNRLLLSQNAPNPFNPATEISFTMPGQGHVRLNVYNIEGRRVRTLVDGQVTAGRHTITWKGKDDAGAQMSSGIYFYRLTTDQTTLTRKMTLLK